MRPRYWVLLGCLGLAVVIGGTIAVVRMVSGVLNGAASIVRGLTPIGPSDFRGVNLGMSRAQVRQAVGSPGDSVTYPDGTLLDYWMILDGTAENQIYYQNDKVVRIVVARHSYHLGQTATKTSPTDILLTPAEGQVGLLPPIEIVRIDGPEAALVQPVGQSGYLLLTGVQTHGWSAHDELQTNVSFRIAGCRSVPDPAGAAVTPIDVLVAEAIPQSPSTSPATRP